MTLVPGTWEAEVGAKATKGDFKKWFRAVCYKEFHFYRKSLIHFVSLHTS